MASSFLAIFEAADCLPMQGLAFLNCVQKRPAARVCIWSPREATATGFRIFSPSESRPVVWRQLIFSPWPLLNESRHVTLGSNQISSTQPFLLPCLSDARALRHFLVALTAAQVTTSRVMPNRTKLHGARTTTNITRLPQQRTNEIASRALASDFLKRPLSSPSTVYSAFTF